MFSKKDENKKRFEIIYKDGAMAGCKILVDRETGVNYLYSWDGYSGGLTPLLNSDGTPIVSTITEKY